ncbi:MAG TPA: NAD(P)-binding domain-containing protein [Vicinamibacterales bacterium]|jgi:predicted dinucleotide-binding enzyme|nr:NAD(P)-binding domain-containing protein [Vicinamibacterales bacterium]
MNVGILGAGNMTTALGRRFIAKGHTLLISFSRSADKLEKTARDLGGGTRVGSPADAAAFGDVVLLSTGWDGAPQALKAAGALDEKVIWSIVTPLKTDLSGLSVGTTTSGSEELAKLVPRAAFVAAWPPFAEVLASSSTRFGAERQTLFYCGDAAAPKRVVKPLFESLDVDAVDAGPLSSARFVEPAMFLLVHLAYAQKMGQVATRLLHR